MLDITNKMVFIIQYLYCQEVQRKTTKEILAESFREMAEYRPVDRITIREIVDNCEYSPATFYRHFRDKYDLIAWDYVHQTNEIINRVGTDAYEWKDTLTDGIRYFRENKEYMQNLLCNTSGHDAFIRWADRGLERLRILTVTVLFMVLQTKALFYLDINLR